LNFRAYDIATLINESMIDYSFREVPKYHINYDHMMSFEEGEEVDRIIKIYMTRYY
jgi:hypothetical protein